MNDYRYSLDKGSKKYLCPSCNKKTFVRYIDTLTGEYLPDQYGSCDRKSKCGYFLNPYIDGYAKNIWTQEQGNKTNWKPTKVKKVKKVNVQKKSFFYPLEILKRTLTGYEQNTFIQNLLTRVTFPFEVPDVEKVISLYHLGTVQNGYRKGAITFPYIDVQDNIRAVQVKQFDKENHTISTDFLHSIIEKHCTRIDKPLPEWLEAYNKNETKVSCLFGEHLLSKYPSNPVALVEAPKTAIYGTLYFGFPDDQPLNFLWLAVYNKSSFLFDKLKVLQGRFVYVFPDLSKEGNTFKEWETKAKEYENRLPGTRFKFSDLLEQLAPQQDKEQGDDLADFLIKQDWRLFRKGNIQEQHPQPEPEKVIKVTKVTHQQNSIFSNEIAELESYFASIELPTQPIQLNPHSASIQDCAHFLKETFAIIKRNNKSRTTLTHLNRLRDLKEVLTSLDN